MGHTGGGTGGGGTEIGDMINLIAEAIKFPTNEYNLEM
jgi:hypothetical protein